jgi:hypothetical protein
MAKHLPNKCKAQSSNPTPAPKKKKKKKSWELVAYTCNPSYLGGRD